MQLDDELSRLPDDIGTDLANKAAALEAVWDAAVRIGQLCPPEECVTLEWLEQLRGEALALSGFADMLICAAWKRRRQEGPPEPNPVLDKLAAELDELAGSAPPGAPVAKRERGK